MKVPESKGGGSRSINASKSATLSELKEQICNVYFTDGHAPLYELKLADLDVFLANFSGIQIEETIKTSEGDNVSFTFGLYLETQKSSPIRIYLHTKESGKEVCKQIEHSRYSYSWLNEAVIALLHLGIRV